MVDVRNGAESRGRKIYEAQVGICVIYKLHIPELRTMEGFGIWFGANWAFWHTKRWLLGWEHRCTRE
jgi:hypothetical protein